MRCLRWSSNGDKRSWQQQLPFNDNNNSRRNSSNDRSLGLQPSDTLFFFPLFFFSSYFICVALGYVRCDVRLLSFETTIHVRTTIVMSERGENHNDSEK